jgi:hypothetical protein
MLIIPITLVLILQEQAVDGVPAAPGGKAINEKC